MAGDSEVTSNHIPDSKNTKLNNMNLQLLSGGLQRFFACAKQTYSLCVLFFWRASSLCKTYFTTYFTKAERPCCFHAAKMPQMLSERRETFFSHVALLTRVMLHLGVENHTPEVFSSASSIVALLYIKRPGLQKVMQSEKCASLFFLLGFMKPTTLHRPFRHHEGLRSFLP